MPDMAGQDPPESA